MDIKIKEHYADVILNECKDLIIREGVNMLSVKKLSEQLFPDAFHSVTIPASLTEFDPEALSGCAEFRTAGEHPLYSAEDGILFSKDKTKLIRCPKHSPINRYTIPSGVIEIASHAFDGCALQHVVIPDSVEKIGAHAFNSTELSEVVIPASVKSIDCYAFGHCLKLTSVSLPDTVTYIGELAFFREINTYLYHTGGLGSDLKIILYRGDIRVPFILQDHWGHNQEERYLDFCITRQHMAERIANFELLKKSVYKYPVAIFMLLTNPENAFFAAYVKRNIRAMMKLAIDLHDTEIAQRLLELKYMNQNQVDECILYANAQKQNEIQLMIMNYKNEHIGYDKGKKFKL